MSSVILFLIFWGIAAIIKRREATAKTTSAPTNEEREDIERRIREIFQQPATPAAATTPTPAERRAEAPKPRRATHPAESTTHAKPKKKASRTIAQTNPQANNNSFRVKQTQAATNTTASPTTAKSEIESAVEDFSLERAVIYAEILEPKFKEY